MRSFTTLWFGQIVSLIGSAMTWFAFTIWAGNNGQSLGAGNDQFLCIPANGFVQSRCRGTYTIKVGEAGRQKVLAGVKSVGPEIQAELQAPL